MQLVWFGRAYDGASINATLSIESHQPFTHNAPYRVRSILEQKQARVVSFYVRTQILSCHSALQPVTSPEMGPWNLDLSRCYLLRTYLDSMSVKSRTE